jgi:tetratricopeptide (TPR) repeat protein
VANYDVAISIDATIPMYFSDRGNSRMQMGDNNGAIADLTHAIELDPAYASAYARRGWAFLGIEDYTRAGSDFAMPKLTRPDGG